MAGLLGAGWGTSQGPPDCGSSSGQGPPLPVRSVAWCCKDYIYMYFDISRDIGGVNLLF